MGGKPIAKIDLTSFTTAEEMQSILALLVMEPSWVVERVPNPENNEPDFYLTRKNDEEMNDKIDSTECEK